MTGGGGKTGRRSPHSGRESPRGHVLDVGVGDAILNAASDYAADLLVIGAYGHSRMRELVLGGVTRHLLRHMTVPVLMSH